jgi:chaperonin cofactor prefoldin
MIRSLTTSYLSTANVYKATSTAGAVMARVSTPLNIVKPSPAELKLSELKNQLRALKTRANELRAQIRELQEQIEATQSALAAETRSGGSLFDSATGFVKDLFGLGSGGDAHNHLNQLMHEMEKLQSELSHVQNQIKEILQAVESIGNAAKQPIAEEALRGRTAAVAKPAWVMASSTVTSLMVLRP